MLDASASASTGDNPEKKDDFCLVLCGFKESNVDLNRLKEQFNMQFIGQVNNKRKSDSGEAEDISEPAEGQAEPDCKKVKKETEEVEENKKDESNQATSEKEGMKCTNCNISFVNVSTFRAHVNFYCKKADQD